MPKIKKIGKQKNKKASNVIPLKRDVKHIEAEELAISVEEQERKRTNEFARKICDEIDTFVAETKLSADYAYYHFLFHLKQRTIGNVSYLLFKQANDASSNEVIQNLAEYHKENFPELKTDAENHTIQ
tara:strand:- start:232 stop:615 length:384 start_codon:yes stop_codon:yes gene_type:complete